MATKKPVGALSALETDDEREAYRAQTQGLLSQLVNPEQNWRDEMLSFAGGMSSQQGDFGGALTNAFKAQGAQRDKQQQLTAQFIPQILELLAVQRQNDLAMRMQQQQHNALYGNPQGFMGMAGQGQPVSQPASAGQPAPGGQLQAPQGMSDPAMGRTGIFADIARQFNIPYARVVSDHQFNGGRDIAKMIAERTNPDITFQDGVALDKTAIGQGHDGFRGFVPGVATSADGKTTMRLPTQGGGIRVVAPEGAAATYKQFQDIGNRSAADFQTEVVTPRGENPQLLTRSGAVDLARGAAPERTDPSRATPQRTANPLASRPEDTDRQAIFAQELRDTQARLAQAERAGDPVALERAQGDLAALQREINRAGIKLPAQASSRQVGQTNDLETQMRDAQNRGDVARAQQLRARIEQQRSPSPSVGLELESPAEAARTAGAVKLESDQYADQAKTLKNAKNSISQIDKAIKLLESGEATQSGIGAVADSVAGFFGKELPGMAAAEELKNIQGWVVANVPRMEGPQSNFDVLNYQTMAGVMGNTSLPIGVRIRAAKRARDMIASAAPQYFGSQDWDRDEQPTSKPLIDPAAIRAERARRQGAR